MGDRHSTHFFIMAAQLSQATIWLQGLNKTEAVLSEHTRQSSIWKTLVLREPKGHWEKLLLLRTFLRSSTYSLHSKHFFTLGEHWLQTVMWPQGMNKTSLFWSEQTIHSSKHFSSTLWFEPASDLMKLFIWLLLIVSFWQLDNALQRFGSGHRSRGVCPFLFLTVRLAPLAAKKQAMDADDFLSDPWVPRPINSLPTSCMSCSWRNWDKVWCLKASWSGVSPSLSWMFRLHRSLTKSRTICVCCLSTARWSAVCRLTFWRSMLALPECTNSSATSTWLLSAAKCKAVYPSSFFSSTIHGRVSFDNMTLIALKKRRKKLCY